MKEKGSSGIESEAGQSLRSWGWSAEAVRDALRCPRCGCMIYPSARSGAFDFKVDHPLWKSQKMQRLSVEVKYGETSFPFSKWQDNKWEWADHMQEDHPEVQLWIWLCIGRARYDDKYPRHTYLFPLEVFENIIADHEGKRKSIEYDCSFLLPYMLKWDGGGFWNLPKEHPLQESKTL